jgi:hypothetical protein
MDLADTPDDLDLTLRHVSQQFPEMLARALLPPGTTIGEVSWVETQITARQRRMDRALAVVADGEKRIEHTEWQLEMEADMALRIFEYHALSALALAASTPAGQPVPRIESQLVLLSGRSEPWPEEGEYRTSPSNAPFCGVKFRIEPVYQRTIAELEAKDSPLWMIFAPLAVDADPEQMKRVLARLRAQTRPREFQELSVALTVIADADKRQRGLRQVILSSLNEEVVMQSWVFRQGVEKGRQEERQEGLVRQFERRLGRKLADDERATLVKRLGALGPDRLDDVVLDLSTDALAAWLADPNAT